MTDAERVKVLTGRVNTLEAMTMAFAGMVLAQTGNDPDKTKTIAFLDWVRETALRLSAVDYQDDCGPETAQSADFLLSSISENLHLLRGKG
jgi:hypothetical protein